MDTEYVFKLLDASSPITKRASTPFRLAALGMEDNKCKTRSTEPVYADSTASDKPIIYVVKPIICNIGLSQEEFTILDLEETIRVEVYHGSNEGISIDIQHDIVPGTFVRIGNEEITIKVLEEGYYSLEFEVIYNECTSCMFYINIDAPIVEEPEPEIPPVEPEVPPVDPPVEPEPEEPEPEEPKPEEPKPPVDENTYTSPDCNMYYSSGGGGTQKFKINLSEEDLGKNFAIYFNNFDYPDLITMRDASGKLIVTSITGVSAKGRMEFKIPKRIELPVTVIFNEKGTMEPTTIFDFSLICNPEVEKPRDKKGRNFRKGDYPLIPVKTRE